MKKNLIEVRCCLAMHDVCDFPLLSKCLCSNDIECSKGAFMYFFFFFVGKRAHRLWNITECSEKEMCGSWLLWKMIWLKESYLCWLFHFFFFAFKTKIFVYTCSNRPNEVSIEFLWLYVITVDIYICEICLLFLLTSCFSLWRVCECHIILLYLKKTQHLINMIVFFYYNTAHT